jgi:hypothetical protein
MLLRIWMILVLALYPALAGWMPPGECPKTKAALLQAAATCCQAAPAAKSCCATVAEAKAVAPARSCCAAAPEVETACAISGPGDECALLGYCRGPCRHGPAAPLAPPWHRETQGQPDKGSAGGEMSHPLLAAVSPPPGRAASWKEPQAVPVSMRLAIICLRTI